jgi:hypothetical protein
MTLLERYLEQLTACLTPDVARRIVEFRPNEKTESRLAHLRQRANEGELSDAERSEYQEFVELVDFVGLLKAQARAALDPPAK